MSYTFPVNHPQVISKYAIFSWKWENTGKNCTYSMILIYFVRDNPGCHRLLAMLNLTYMDIEIGGPKYYWLIDCSTVGYEYILTVSLWTFAKLDTIFTSTFHYYQKGTNISNACNSVPLHFWAKFLSWNFIDPDQFFKAHHVAPKSKGEKTEQAKNGTRKRNMEKRNTGYFNVKN